jgi:hypothetical protein
MWWGAVAVGYFVTRWSRRLEQEAMRARDKHLASFQKLIAERREMDEKFLDALRGMNRRLDA